ncbi:MAG TPA: molybdate ABC transporter substrate-binding protein [Ardenticatenaceae bacterium]|nr:molybdate ABC transporter substrate-binding protein [Ardenticatenaceae bacterium]
MTRRIARLPFVVFLVLITSCTRATPAPPTQSVPVDVSGEPAAEPTGGQEPTSSSDPATPTGEAESEATPEPASGELVVFTASSLTEAFTRLGEQFEADHPGVTVAFNFAGSQRLAQQLAQGARADVFASASQAPMDAAIEAGHVAPGSVQVFVRNRLVVIYPVDNPAGITTPQDLARPGVRLVLAAAEVPVGQYSLEFLDKATQAGVFGASFKDAVLGNVVSYEENVRAVLSKVALGEADAGIVYSSDVSGEGSAEVGRVTIPVELNVIASYPIAPVSDSASPELARAFVELVLSPRGQEVLAQYGFIPVGQR